MTTITSPQPATRPSPPSATPLHAQGSQQSSTREVAEAADPDTGLPARVNGAQRTDRGVASRLAAVPGTIARFLRPITTVGWLVLGTAAVAFVLAFALGWVEFVFVGVTLCAAFVLALFSLIGRMSFQVSAELEPRRVTAGQRSLGRLTVHNSGARPTAPTRLELPVGAAVAEFVIPRLATGAEDENLFAVPTQRRAVVVAGPATTVRGDALGLLRRASVWTQRIELFVHPVVVRIASTSQGLVRDLEGHETALLSNSDLAFHALREYEPGDDIRNVHWRTSARTGRLMVRQYQETRRSQLLLLMDTERGHYATDDEFELAVSAFASVGVGALRDETPMRAWSTAGALRTRTHVSLLDDSCRIAPTDSLHSSLREFARVAGMRAPTPSLVVVAVGSRTSDAEVAALAALYGGETRIIAMRCAPERAAGQRRVGRATVVDVPSLDQLASLVDRVNR
ncbi:DUF58 domain-containing protein [Planctomonas sp. JC2975]|uniref:DUF58 domain-containing protein n=1 Tax=Planctomonas sp. JC2975 TaxID=2729626 RepID=UPI001474758C|nr:DUF58 domain-containing protein [Planctomonas sp. JC2975]NNC11008.1 DUF58 domain-containing protein [Planctomonas sp. JC2975]